MSQNASGAFTRIALKREAAYDTIPSGDWVLVPVYSYGVAETVALNNQPLLGRGRSAQRAQRETPQVQGSIVAPIDARNIGHWLTALLGPPDTTGADAPYTHVWKDGAVALPSLSVEAGHILASPLYAVHSGLMINSAQFTLSQQGVPQLTMQALASRETRGTSSSAGAPTSLAIDLFQQRENVLKKDGAALGRGLSFTPPFTNNLDPVRYIGGGGAVGDIDHGIGESQGQLQVRFSDWSLFTLAAGGTVFALEYGFERSASQKITFKLEQAELVPQGKPIEGPGGIAASFTVAGSSSESAGNMLTVTLVNDVEGY